MKLRIVSDLHIDVNRKFDVKLPYDDAFTLIAGDLGGDYEANEKWLKANVKKGAFISGNHDSYNRSNVPIEDIKDFYHEKFPESSDIVYLDESIGVMSKQLDDKVLLVADVMYTDYKLRLSFHKGKKLSEVIENNMWQCTPKMSGTYLNDFNFLTKSNKYAKYEMDKYTKLHYIHPNHYLDHFNRAFKKMSEIVESNPDKDVILMTHHCLSPKCISTQYVDSVLNASYASDKESWIKKHPNIKLVISGHVHHRSEFKVGNALFLTNPLGYIKNIENIQNDGLDWTPNLFVDTSDWTVSRSKYENRSWKKIQDEYAKKM